MTAEQGLMSTRRASVIAKLAGTLDEAMTLLRDAAYAPVPSAMGELAEATLLQQCLRLCAQQQVLPVEPIRLVHHFACTGGTVISKALGTLPNVQLLSEVDPLSPLLFDPSAPSFAPTDINRLLRQGTRGADRKVLVELFQAEMRVLHRHAEQLGQYLVLRDHSHSHYCTGPQIAQRPALRACLPPDIPVLSVMTVRHPADSYASLVETGWPSNFEPNTFSEYCRRHLAFLDANPGVPMFQYERFAAHPDETLRAICNALALPFNPDFADALSVIHLTGDSGRRSSWVGPRSRRGLALQLIEGAAALTNYQALTRRLGYDDAQSAAPAPPSPVADGPSPTTTP